MRRSSYIAKLAPLLLFGCIPYLMSGCNLKALPGEGAEGRSEGKVEQWIKDLGSESFAKREAATRALMNLEDEPLDLRKQLKSSDLELRRRVVQILDAYVPKRAKRELAKVRVLAKEGRVDEMAERLVLWKKYDTGEGWKALVELAAQLAARADFTYDKTHFYWLLDPKDRGESKELIYDKTKFRWVNKPLQGVNQPKEKLVPKNLAKKWQYVFEPVRETNITIDKPGGESRKIIIASGDAEKITRLSQGILVTGKNLVLGEVSLSVIVCDGECELKGQIMDSLIIARGRVTCSRGVSCNHSVILGEDFIDGAEHLRLVWSLLSNGSPNGFVRFFNPYDIGISAWNVLDKKGQFVPGGTQILEIREGTPFASKLRAKDLVTAIGETKTPTFEVFRRVLRRKLAEGGPLIIFTVRRADKTLEVPIPVKD